MLAPIVNVALNNCDFYHCIFSQLHYILFNHFEMVTAFNLIQTNVELRSELELVNSGVSLSLASDSMTINLVIIYSFSFLF